MPSDIGEPIKIFEDPTPDGLICGRFFTGLQRLTQVTDLTDEEGYDLTEGLMALGRKLAMVWSHYQDYVREQDAAIKRLQSKPGEVNREVPHKLLEHADGFFVDMKSCLDYLVKVPRPILGPKRWNLVTFRDKGRAVAKAIRASVPKQHEDIADDIAKAIEQCVPIWLEPAIKLRDRINHCKEGGLDFRNFLVTVRVQDGKVVAEVPMANPKQTLRDYLHIVWTNLFVFCEKLVGMFLSLRLVNPDVITFSYEERPLSDVNSPWALVARLPMKG